MIKHKWIGVLAVLLMVVAVLLMGLAYLKPSLFQSITGSAEPAYASAMDKNEIMSLQIIADPKEWADMLENATAEEYIPATVIINGSELQNVGIRPKGKSSLSMVAQNDTTDRFSFKIEFDHYISGQTWLGLDKIAVNNMQGDASYMKEYLSYDIMDFAGVEAPLYQFADISVNGETWGFYLAVECLEDSYAERVYGKDHGSLYKPESMGGRGQGRMNDFIEAMPNDNKNAPRPAQEDQQYQVPGAPPQSIQRSQPTQEGQPNQASEQLQASVPNRENRGGPGGGGGMAADGVSLQYTDDEYSSYAGIFDNSVIDSTEKDHKCVIQALEKLSQGQDLESTVDVEAVLQYFAAHTTVVNLDSYVSSMGHNYYLYEDDGQLTILPWDYNLAFGGFQSGNASSVVNFPIDTPVSGVSLEDRPLLGKLLEVPEYSELYHSYLRQIVDGYFNSGQFEQTIDSLNALISSYVENDPSAFYNYEAYQAAVVELKELGLLRAESMAGQLDGTIPSTSEVQSADPSQLVDAAGVDLSVLGSQGGGPGGMSGGGEDRRPDSMGPMTGLDREIIPQVMEIIQATGENDLTEEQVSQLKELGLTDEQIVQLRSMEQNRPGPIGGGGQRPDRPPGSTNSASSEANPGLGKQSSITAGFDTHTWIYMGGCVALLLAGMLLVFFFRRRRH